MNKKLLAVAVAGALAAPVAAFAQSSVTISGLLKGGFEGLRLGSSARANASQTGVTDDSSRIVFNVVEDLGGGLQAIGQMDIRIKPDDPGGAVSLAGLAGGGVNTGNIIGGNTHFGLRSKNWGRIFLGRQDLHYFNNESNLTDKGALRATSVSLLAYIQGAAIAAGSRTQNVVHYTTPNWSGFTVIAAYSSNPGGQETDISSGIRKGRAFNLNPNYAARNWQVGYSYWSSKPDGAGGVVAAPAGGAAGVAGTAATDQRADRLYGSYTFPMGLKIGLAWDKSKTKSSAGGGDLARRTAWSLPVGYTWGPHSVHAHYTKARDEQVSVARDGAKMFAMAYAYDLSKRTSVALTYARIDNDAGATYNLFASTSLGLGTGAGALVAGEDPKMWGVTLRHAF